ncbi:MAG TPA: nuclear transport factor 2 family protein [Gammaproteobacteria bacterium]|nr:nuclear transport factor 2 family protein [Gammaproteobacteria bacterium]
MQRTAVIRKIYRDFAAGDAAPILGTFADDVEFRLAEGHPYRGRDGAWLGKQEITEKFFAVAGPEWDRWSIAIDQILEADDAVIVEGRYGGTYKPTGNAMHAQVCHVWRFRGSEVASFHQYVDTAALRRVMGRSGV